MRIKRKKLATLLAAVIIATAAMVLFAWSKGSSCLARADTGQPSAYCGFIDFTVTNNTGGDLTNYPVRFTAPVNSLISSGRADQMGWQWYCAESAFSNGRNLLLQDITESSSAIWIVFPDLPDGETRTARCYIGRAETIRDQGLWFTGGEHIDVPDSAEPDISDNLRIDMIVQNMSETPRSEIWLYNYAMFPNTGYRVRTPGSAPYRVTFDVDGASCELTWDTAWTDTPTLFSFRYTSAAGDDAFIFVNDVQEQACDLDQGAIGAPASDLAIGYNVLAGTGFASDMIISDVSIMDSSGVVAHYGFDAGSLDETTPTNTFAGTAQDYSPNDLDGTYSFDRDQTNLTVETGGYTLTTSNSGPTFTPAEVDVVGEILPGSAFGAVGNQNASTWPLSMFNPPAGSAIPRTAYWSLLLSGFAVILGLLAYMVSNKVIIAIVAAGAIYTVGVTDGVLPAWWLIYWAFGVTFSVAASKWSRES